VFRVQTVGAILGALLLVGVPTVWTLTRPGGDVGPEPFSVPEPDPTESWCNPDQDPGCAAPRPEAPGIGVSNARLDAAAPAAVVPPTGIRIPSLDVDATVVPVGVEADGQMEVPADVREVGWYRFGPVPGDPGSAVLAGHVDSRAQGLGVFAALRDLAAGAEVEVVAADGTVTAWVVTARRTIAKPELPVDELFRRDGPPRLVLVTCGGEFDRGASSYRDNVVVTLEPA
jgi:hypothetical protein